MIRHEKGSAQLGAASSLLDECSTPAERIHHKDPNDRSASRTARAMIHALVSGSLFRDPEQRQSKAGKPFTCGTIKRRIPICQVRLL